MTVPTAKVDCLCAAYMQQLWKPFLFSLLFV